jgi:hypothetical protein
MTYGRVSHRDRIGVANDGMANHCVMPGEVCTLRLDAADGVRHWKAASYACGLKGRKHGADSASERPAGSL